jgi:protein regulator of cytokinesis 1
LTQHEEEVQRLQSELNSKEGILQRVEEWADLRIQQQELEAKRNGPDRFNTRGGALLLEERTRKRIEKKMPLVSTLGSYCKLVC